MKIAVVGATGMVGTVMLKVLAERNFPVTELIPVASEKSIGKELEYNGQQFKVDQRDKTIEWAEKRTDTRFHLGCFTFPTTFFSLTSSGLLGI